MTPTHTYPPVWLLDIDGVVNATRPGWSCAPWTTTVAVAGRELRLRWAPQLIYTIRTLSVCALAEVRWCSSWGSQASIVQDAMDLPPLGNALPEIPIGQTVQHAKLQAARDVLQQGRRLIWTDDEVVPAPGTASHRLLHVPGRTLLIRPTPRKGLLPEHALRIIEFCQDDQQAPGPSMPRNLSTSAPGTDPQQPRATAGEHDTLE